MLEDGAVFRGRGFGVPGAVLGELVFNTSMTGYQEVVTDPSYHGQIVTFTYPLIGNYGANTVSSESDRIHSLAIVVREAHNLNRNSSAEQGWVDWLIEQGATGVSGIDTRALTRHIRSQGAKRAGVFWGDFSEAEMAEKIAAVPSMAGQDIASLVSCKQAYELQFLKGKYNVVAVDYGIKRSILKRLGAAGCNVIVVPATFSAEEIWPALPSA